MAKLLLKDDSGKSIEIKNYLSGFLLEIPHSKLRVDTSRAYLTCGQAKLLMQFLQENLK